MSGNTTYRWFWRTLPARRGQVFREVASGPMNSCLIEFEDGFRVLVSRQALRVRLVEAAA